MRVETIGKLLLGALTSGLWLPAAQANTCLLLYQMADNNLEYYLRQDYEELSKSSVVNDPALEVFIYYDALDGGPLPGLYNQGGGAENGNFRGSRYVHYDRSQGRMVVEQQLNGEQNSDTPATIQNFLEYGMKRCVASGHLSFMAVFASHGGGFAGYGGDENPARRVLGSNMYHRGVLQTNQGIASAIRAALDNTSGAPGRLSVLGFDACLMQAFDAADDYMDVADHILASEAVEPGHGWAYTYLTRASDAKTFAMDVVDTFVDQTQGGSNHQTPKTLGVITTDGYQAFAQEFEAFSRELLNVIQGGDAPVHAYIARARSNAVAFEGIVDAVGTKFPSAVDVGSVLEQFKDMCNPGGTLGSNLDAAIIAYRNMWVSFRTGPGTAPGTGMHITWPDQNEYRNNGVWNQVLFGAAEYQTAIAPNFREFLNWFLNNNAPNGVGGNSICGKGIELPPASATTSAEPQLLYDAAADVQPQFVRLSAQMDPAVDQVVVEYAVELTTPLYDLMKREGYPHEEGDYLFLLGGDVKGTYDGSSYSATWNRDFYFLDVFGRSTYEALYTFDQGNGAKSVPCLYFTEASRQAITVNNEIGWLEYLLYNETKFRELGAAYGFLTFSVNGQSGIVDNNLILFTSGGTSNVFAEKRRADKGFIFPMVYVDAIAKGNKLSALPGGFNQTWIDWDESLDYQIIATPAAEILEVIPSTDAVVINLYGHDFELNAPLATDAYYFDVIRPDRGGPTLTVGSNGDASASGGMAILSLVGTAAVGVMTLLMLV